jgi:lauroyl/myristoyl acyltransferase
VEEEEKTSWKRRIGVFGDLPTRVLMRGLKVFPWFLEPVLMAVWTLFFFLVAGEQRRAVISNLKALFPMWSGFRAFFGAYRVFWNFAGTYVDAMRSETGTGEVDWVIEGLEYFEQLSSHEGGCLILTAHMGNYDMAAPLFSSKFGKTVYAVRAPEREAEMQAVKEAELREKERLNPFFKTLYNDGGEMLGVELARLLNEGNVVAIQGDRVVFEVSSSEVEVAPDLMMSLPKGPLFLARISKAKCFPLFIIRDGWRRYRVKVLPALELPPRKRGAGEDPGLKVWTDALLEGVIPHWDQWFVFEPVFRRLKGGES